MKSISLIIKLGLLESSRAQISMRPWERIILMIFYNIKNMLLNYSYYKLTPNLIQNFGSKTGAAIRIR